MKISFLFISLSFSIAIAQAQEDVVDFGNIGLTFGVDLIIREDHVDQGGLGPAFILGSVIELGETDRMRLIPSLEYGLFKWQEDDILNDYFAINVLGQIDVIRFRKYSIPMSGGAVLDFNNDENGNLKVKEAFKLYLGNRLVLKDGWAIEFLNFGLTVNRDFAVVKGGYFSLEKKF